VLVWHGIEAVFDALLYTGLVIVPLALMALGAAMLGTPHYGRRIGKATVALGVAGLVAAAAVLAGVPDLAAVGVLILLGFHFCVGRTTLQLAHAPKPALVAAA
jgi:vacuolar-type H+-ATPase subunit I/STV1